MAPQARGEKDTWGLEPGPTNAEILGSAIEPLPRTLSDYEDIEPHRMVTLHEAIGWAMSRVVGVAWDNGDFLSSLRWLNQLDQRLPPPSPQNHGVYLVAAPRGEMRYRFIHWSLYSQGHFYHLTATKPGMCYLDAASKPSSRLTEPGSPLPVDLMVQNVIEHSTTNFTPLTPKIETTALQAYHIGDTRFTAKQIHQIAASITGHISSYNALDKNCQLFAISLAWRTVMTQRDCSVFVGHMYQIAAWDSAGRPAASEGYHRKATGYVLADPRMSDESTRPRTVWEMLGLDAWPSLRMNRHALEISELYSKGESAMGTYDPEGRRTGFRYIWYRLRKESFATEQWKLIGDDMRGGRWRDAFYGRFEERRQIYVEKERRARNGSTATQLLLPIHRAYRGVTKEERKQWAAEAEEMSKAEALSKTWNGV
jgi:hypothetical protein